MEKNLNASSTQKTAVLHIRINPEIREQALIKLMRELKAGEESVRSESDWISEEEVITEL